MARYWSVSYMDASSEIGSSKIGLSGDADGTDIAELLSDFNGVTLGVAQRWYDTTETALSNSVPTNDAEREEKLLIGYQDNTSLKKYVFTIPTFDKSSGTRIGATDFFQTDAGAIGTLVTDLNALMRSPEGNAITVLYAKYVGRNS